MVFLPWPVNSKQPSPQPRCVRTSPPLPLADRRWRSGNVSVVGEKRGGTRGGGGGKSRSWGGRREWEIGGRCCGVRWTDWTKEDGLPGDDGSWGPTRCSRFAEPMSRRRFTDARESRPPPRDVASSTTKCPRIMMKKKKLKTSNKCRDPQLHEEVASSSQRRRRWRSRPAMKRSRSRI